MCRHSQRCREPYPVVEEQGRSSAFRSGERRVARDGPDLRCARDNPEACRRGVGTENLNGRTGHRQPYATAPAFVRKEPDILWAYPFIDELTNCNRFSTGAWTARVVSARD